jgi:hypothetical protein
VAYLFHGRRGFRWCLQSLWFDVAVPASRDQVEALLALLGRALPIDNEYAIEVDGHGVVLTRTK